MKIGGEINYVHKREYLPSGLEPLKSHFVDVSPNTVLMSGLAVKTCKVSADPMHKLNFILELEDDKGVILLSFKDREEFARLILDPSIKYLEETIKN
jgi:hypothetical protein